MDKNKIENELVLRVLNSYEQDGVADVTRRDLIKLTFSKNVLPRILKNLEILKDIENITKQGLCLRYNILTKLDCPEFLLLENISVTMKKYLLVGYNNNLIEYPDISHNKLEEIFETSYSNISKVLNTFKEESYFEILKTKSGSTKSTLNNYTIIPKEGGLAVTNISPVNKECKCAICGNTDPVSFTSYSGNLCKECYNKRNRERYVQKMKEDIGEWLYKKCELGYARRNKIHDIDVTADFLEELYNKQGGLCYYTRTPFTEDDKPSVDRIDSNKGYTQDNVVICKSSINFMKQAYSMEQFKQNIIDLYNNINNF